MRIFKKMKDFLFPAGPIGSQIVIVSKKIYYEFKEEALDRLEKLSESLKIPKKDILSNSLATYEFLANRLLEDPRKYVAIHRPDDSIESTVVIPSVPGQGKGVEWHQNKPCMPMPEEK